MAAVAECDDLKLKYSEEQEKRKKLYNQIQEAKGNLFYLKNLMLPSTSLAWELH